MKITTVKRPPSPSSPERPRCPQCRRALAPSWRTIDEHMRGPVSEWWRRQEWDGTYRSYGYFDTMRCAVDYANAAHARRLGKATYTSGGLKP